MIWIWLRAAVELAASYLRVQLDADETFMKDHDNNEEPFARRIDVGRACAG